MRAYINTEILVIYHLIFKRSDFFHEIPNNSSKDAKNWRAKDAKGGRNKSGQSTAKYRSFLGVSLCFSTCDAYHSLARSMRYVLRSLRVRVPPIFNDVYIHLLLRTISYVDFTSTLCKIIAGQRACTIQESKRRNNKDKRICASIIRDILFILKIVQIAFCYSGSPKNIESSRVEICFFFFCFFFKEEFINH